MLPVKMFALALLLASVGVGCVASSNDSDDTSPAEPTAETPTSMNTSSLSDGLGNDIPMPVPFAKRMPWDDIDWKPPMPRHDQDELDHLGPEHPCGIGWKTLYDPGRGRNVHVPIVVCE